MFSRSQFLTKIMSNKNGPFMVRNKAKTQETRSVNSMRSISSEISHQYEGTDKFLAVFPDIVSSLVENACKAANTQLVGPWIKELLEYNSPGGFKVRGLMVVTAYQLLEDPSKITEESMRRARIIGWCVELLQTSSVIIDDILDKSKTRRGSDCWYQLSHVGRRAINDSEVLNCLTYQILRHNFGTELIYPHLLNCLNECKLSLSLGQHLDYTILRQYHNFTMENYKNISAIKLANVTTKITAHCGLLLTNNLWKDPFKNVEDIFEDIGILAMIQNDKMDCFGEENISGKVGTDIQEGKCTWFAVKALERFNPAQRAEFEACYGSTNEEHVKRIKQMYLDLQLLNLYYETVNAYYESIVRRIQALPNNNILPPHVILKLLEMIYLLRSPSTPN